jgi:hypothetical protein
MGDERIEVDFSLSDKADRGGIVSRLSKYDQ